MNNQFVFESKQKNFFFGLMAVGIISMVLTYVLDHDPAHTRFWTNFLQNSVFFTGIAFIATFMLAATITIYSGWHTVVKRIWEAQSMFLIVGLCLIGVIVAGVWGHFHHLYHWADTEHISPKDHVLNGKLSFLNKYWFTVATFGFGGIWYFFATKFRKLSIEQDKASFDVTYPYYTKMKGFAAVFLPIAGFTSAAAIWQWVMSLDAHWYSTMFAWYTTASWLVSMVSVTILLVIYLKSKGYLQEVTNEHMHDLGKFLFAFSVFWTYLWFSQYMLIWYSNNGEETIYFRYRMSQYPVLFYGNLVLNFVLPFLILMRNDTKRKFGTVGFTAVVVLFGHWWDFFQMVKIGPFIESRKAMAEHGAAHGAEHGAAAAHGAEHVAEAATHAVGHGAEHAVSNGIVEMTPYFTYTPNINEGFFVPGLLELGSLCFFVGLFLYMVFTQLGKASLVVTNDPYLAESKAHHVV